MSDADKVQMPKDFKAPSMDEMMKMVDSMKGMTEEDREKIREQLLKRVAFQNPFSDEQIPSESGDLIPPIAAATAFEIITLVIYLVMVTSFIAIFGKVSIAAKQFDFVTKLVY